MGGVLVSHSKTLFLINKDIFNQCIENSSVFAMCMCLLLFLCSQTQKFSFSDD